MAERQRRKAARESSSSSSSSSHVPSASLVGDVTRRASLLWPGRKQHPPSRSGLGTHTALRSRESVDQVPLEDIPGTPTAPSPTTPDENHPGNPFANPSSSLSPFDDFQQQTALMTPSSDSSLQTTEDEMTPTRPVVKASTSRPPPPPQPLGLPTPRTPPPPISATHTNRPPRAASPPIMAPTPPEPEGDLSGETRWWHDWLCGCGEGPDRGGDNQVRFAGVTCALHEIHTHGAPRLVGQTHLNNLLGMTGRWKTHATVAYYFLLLEYI
jgi:hypothetical protein